MKLLEVAVIIWLVSIKSLLIEVTAQTVAGITESEDDWWKHAIIYQIYPRSFQDSDGDGIGDLRGIEMRIKGGYFKKFVLADAIWLSPIYKSPMRDFGYDVQDYRAIN